MNSNTIVMRLLEKEVARSRGLFQYDYGQRLVFTGVELPDAYEVHFSNNKVGVSKTVIGDATGVDIPDEFLLKGDPVYVWVFLHTGDADGETEYHGVIDVIKRAKPVHDKPTPAQQDEITQAIAVLNAAVTTTGQDVVDATEAKDAAEAAQAAAEEAQGIAEDARDEAVQAKNAAVSAAEAAEAAKDAAVEAKETSEEIAEALPGTIEAALQEAKDSGEFDGATFVPSIDDGVISWTNDRQLPNPEPVDIAEELELDTYAKKDEIPTKVSELTNDSGYLTTETDPTVSAWAKQPNKPSYTAQEVGAIDVAQKGTANGVAELDADGKVKSGQLPSYVDDVAEYDSMSQFPATGESGKIYIAKDTNITYRWGGSSYVPIGSDLALGETASTAYRGDRGKIAYDHASAKGNAYANGLYKIATNAEGHVTGATPVVKSDITGLGIPGSVPTKTSELQNDSGFITTETDPTVASWAKEPTKPTYTASEVGLGNVANERQYSANNPPPADTTKQDKINVNGILKGTGNGGVTAAVEGTDYINGDLIAVQDETPTDPNTQIWLPETQPESVQVASYAELTNVLNALTQSSENTSIAISAHSKGSLFWYNGGLYVALSAIAVGDTITTTGNTPNAAEVTIDEALIKDVQINGSSILSNGVANVPNADSSTRGVVKTASATVIKAGESTNVPTTNLSDYVAFYGLAKAAGDTTTKAVSGANIGVYTEEGKSKISTMLNAPVTISGTTPVINAKACIRYICGECATLDITVPASGDIEVIFDSGSTATVLTVTPPTGVTAIKWASGFDPTSLEANTRYDLIITDGEWGLAASWEA